MKVKAAIIRKIRSEKLWSQEQLADACGLSLRTIQRVEANSSASAETVRALASVLEMSPEELIGNQAGFKAYRHSQRADHIFIVLFIVFILILTIQSVTGAIDPTATGLCIAILSFVAFLFNSLTIEVNEEFIGWHFGPGFWKKQIPLKQVSECKSVENSFWLGFGIRNYGAGWLYNVSGLHAIELHLVSGAKLRLGTDEPNYLKLAIDEARDNLP